MIKSFPTTIFLICLMLSSSLIAAAQRSEPKSDCGVIVDEFGAVNNEDILARLSNFAISIENSNPNTAAYIVIYRPKNQPSAYSLHWGNFLKGSLVKINKIASEKIKVADGGTESARRTQLILLPESSNCLKPINVETDFDASKTGLFDKFWYSLPSEKFEDECCVIDPDENGKKAVFDAFATLLRNNKTLKGHLILYPQKCRKSGCSAYHKSDSPRFAAKELRRFKKDLAENYKIQPSQLVTGDGGYSESRRLELWLVPETGNVPKPNKIMRFRKLKTTKARSQ